MGQQANNTNWQQRLVGELKADPKKTAVLGILTLVAVFVIGKYLMGNKLPASASAANPGRVVVANASGPVVRARTNQARQDQYLSRLDNSVTRDIFEPDLKLYQAAEKIAEVAKVLPTTTSAPADAKIQMQEQLIQAQASSLKLESTMIGPRSVANINGKLLKVGDVFNEFEIVEITAHSCVVRKNDVSILLEIRN